MTAITKSLDASIYRFTTLFGALTIAVLAGACGRTPSPPYSLAFSAEGSAPGVLTAHGESTVPLEVTNAGVRTWDPAHVHFSYHWLWLVPRELVRRSRTVPYQDGIRTDLGGEIAPGRRLMIDARLLAPDVPGVYWLQWDMVEEGVTWFAQVSPRQPRRLVVVLPTLAGWFAPIPLLVAVGGLVFLRRFQAPDVAWCAATLFAKQMLLFEQAILEPTAVAYWLAAVAAVVPPAVLWAALPRRVRAPALFALGTFGSVLVLGDVVYYRFFGDVLSTPALLAARQTGQVTASIRSLVTLDLAWLVVDLPFAAWLVARLVARREPPLDRRLPAWSIASVVMLACAGLVVGAPRALREAPLDQMFRNRAVVEQLGVFGYHVYDVWSYARNTLMRPAATDAQLREVTSWFVDRAPIRAGPASPLFGLARGKNLIVIQVESLQDFVVDYRVGSQDVMPYLRRWSDEALRFTDVTDQTNEGRTSDAEFVALTSLLPLDHGAVAFRYPANHYVGFPHVLAEHGYATVSAVPFEAGFWNRRVMHPLYGFEHSLFEPDFELTEQIGWGLNDHDFLQQMIPRLEKMPKPFGAWLITLSLHHPFDGFPDRHKVLKLGEVEGTPFGNYLHTMRFFDQALEDFKEALARDGLLADTMLVVFGDHDAGFAHDADLARRIGIAPNETGWALADRVPFFVRTPDDSARRPAGTMALPMGQTDFAPTLLTLLGIDAAPLPYVGRDVLGAPDNPPVLRPYGDWLDRAHLFVSHGSTARVSLCYATESGRMADVHDCDATNVAARKGREISSLVIGEDLQQRLRTTLASLVR